MASSSPTGCLRSSATSRRLPTEGNDASGCDPFHVHIDERGNSVTLGFHTKVFPVSTPTEWREKGFNAFEFYLVFEGAEGLRVTAWGGRPLRVSRSGPPRYD